MATIVKRAAIAALALTATVTGTVPALAGNKFAALGGCYFGTYSGFKSGLASEFNLEEATQPSSDSGIQYTFTGRGHEDGEFIVPAIWQSANSNQPGGYLVVKNAIYGSGIYFSGSLNQQENVLLNGRAKMDGESFKLTFVTQRKNQLKFRVRRSTSTIAVSPQNPTVQSTYDPEDPQNPDNWASIDLSALVTNMDNTAILWEFVGSTFDAVLRDEEPVPADATVTLAVPPIFGDPVTITLKATPWANSCVSQTVDVTVLPVIE